MAIISICQYSSSSSMNSVRLIGLIASKNSDLVMSGFLITSRFALKLVDFFIPTSVDTTDCAGTERIN